MVTNARSKELFGYHPEEEMSLDQALSQIKEEYREGVKSHIENAIHHDGDYDVSYPVIGLHDQKLRWLRAIGNLKIDNVGEFSEFTGVLLDVTEQKLSTKRIEQAEESLRMAVDAAGLGTYSIEAINRVFVSSPKLKEFFRFSLDQEVPYDAVIAQIHPDYRQLVVDENERVILNGGKVDTEYPVVGYNDGKMRWVRSVGQLQHSDGKDYFTGVLHEITEKKEDEIRKNDFIGMVSHELKTPLTSLSAIIQLANIKLKKNDDEFLWGQWLKRSFKLNEW